MKSGTDSASPGFQSENASREYTLPSDIKQPKPNPFNPLALNLSKVEKKGDPPQVKDNSYFEKTGEKESWNIKVINDAVYEERQEDMTVTLGPKSNVEMSNTYQKVSTGPVNNNFKLGNAHNFTDDIHTDLYNQERSFRGIYHDDELHALIIFLIFSLILTPQRGTLDNLYCSRYPIADGKPPVLHFLHYHLNHPANQNLIPLILKKVRK